MRKKEKNDIPRDNESTPERHKPKKIKPINLFQTELKDINKMIQA